MVSRIRVATAVALLAMLPLCGCNEDPPAAPRSPAGSIAPAPAASETPGAPPPRRDEPTTTEGSNPTVAEFLGFTAPKPAVWLWHPPETSMRAANYVVPAASGGEQAHVVVFSGIGGGKDANIARWRGQFRDTDHTAVEAHVTELEAGGIPITLVELQGERMRMGDGWYTPNQLLLAAIVHAPEGDVHIMFQGRYETVHANRAAFTTFVEGLRRKGGG